MRRSVLYLAVVMASLLMGEISAQAGIVLRFAPQDTTIVPAGSGRLSIMIDDTLDVRSVNLVVTYDTTVVRSVSGEAGSLYTDSGIYTFQGFEEDTLGQWNGYAVLMGADLAINGPGELYRWDFETLDEGITPVVSVSADVSDVNGDWYADVSLPPTTIIVDDPLSAVGDLPALRPGLRLVPNPFNPRTRILFDLDRAGWVRLAVYDVRGRRVALLHDGPAAAGSFTSSWNGLDADGLAQPGGVYIFRMATSAGPSAAKGVLLK